MNPRYPSPTGRSNLMGFIIDWTALCEMTLPAHKTDPNVWKPSLNAGLDAMTYDDYNAFCASLPATSHVVQWGGSHVWKVGGKVFAIGGWDDGDEPHITFKVSPIAFEMLQEQPGLRPAPYLAPRGMKWIQHHAKPGLSDDELKDYLQESHRIVAAGLSKKKQKELGLAPA